MKVSVPKNWKVVRSSFGRIVWQHGQRNVVATPQPKYRGWKWTTKILVIVEYDLISEKWHVVLNRPSHPLVTKGSFSTLEYAIKCARNTMNEMNISYEDV